MHRKPKTPLRLRLTLRLGEIFRRVTGATARKALDDWCAEMTNDIQARTWITNGT